MSALLTKPSNSSSLPPSSPIQDSSSNGLAFAIILPFAIVAGVAIILHVIIRCCDEDKDHPTPVTLFADLVKYCFDGSLCCDAANTLKRCCDRVTNAIDRCKDQNGSNNHQGDYATPSPQRHGSAINIDNSSMSTATGYHDIQDGGN